MCVCVCTYTNILLSKANRNAYVKNLPTHLPTNLRTYLPPNWTAHPPTDQPIYLPTDLFCNLPPIHSTPRSHSPHFIVPSFLPSLNPSLLDFSTPWQWFHHHSFFLSFIRSLIPSLSRSVTQSLSHSVSQSVIQMPVIHPWPCISVHPDSFHPIPCRST